MLERFIQSGGEVIVYREHVATPIKGAKIINQIENVVDELSISHHDEVVISPSNKAVRVSKVIKGGKLFYFFVNEGEESYRGTFRLKKEGAVEKWDAWKGAIEQVGLIVQDDHLFAPLEIERRGSIVYKVDTDQTLFVEEKATAGVITEKLELKTNWVIDERSDRTLDSWVKWDGMQSFSGTVTYQNQFLLDKKDSIKKVILDLGEAHEIVDVMLNENEIGVKMWAPYQFEINPQYLIDGVNNLIIQVTNNRANEMDDARLPSGLMGPVSLEFQANE